MSRFYKAVLLFFMIVPACDAFVCSAQRKKAMELSNSGVVAFQNSLYDKAERELKTAIQTDPSFTLAYYNLGKVYQKQRKWDKAAEAFEQSAGQEPGNANYQNDLGQALLEMNHLDKAAKALKEAVTLDGSLFKAHWRLGQVYKMLEQPKEADKALRAAIEGNPRFDSAFRDLGYLYLEWDYVKEAEQVLSECVRINEASSGCYNGRGLALKELKEYETATSAFKAAMELEPALLEAIYNLGMTYAEWFDVSQTDEHKAQARDFLTKFVASGGGAGGAGYVKAANDKLYALSGS